jgi:hypothetical protein
MIPTNPIEAAPPIIDLISNIALCKRLCPLLNAVGFG